jgi:steroid 5-alpha reductase family enzyme
LDAIKSELSPDNTKDSFFYLLSAIQLPVMILLNVYFIKNPVFERACYISYGGHWLGWLLSELMGSNKWFDVTEDITYLVCFVDVVRSIGDNPTFSQLAVFGAAFLWGFRLLSFLGFRIIARGSDWRFDALIKNSAYNLFGWTSGGTWCVLNGMCLWTVAGRHTHKGPLSMLTLTGLSIFVIGLLLETLSDWQKYFFRSRGKTWIAEGLWSICRHPNYLGEILVWCGIAIASVGSLKNPFACCRFHSYLCMVSPLWSVFFLFFTSLMLLEKRANLKWGDESSSSAVVKADYAEYKRAVPILLPFHL